MYTNVTVKKVNKDGTVSVSCSSSSCSGCSASAFCSSKNVTEYKVLNSKNKDVKEGDTVEIFLPPGKTILSVAIVFAVPLALFPAGYYASVHCLGFSELHGALGGFVAMALAFIVSGFAVSKRKRSLMPVITGVYDNSASGGSADI